MYLSIKFFIKVFKIYKMIKKEELNKKSIIDE